MDGTLGSQTARLLDGSGVEITSREELAEIVRAGARAGWPVAVHAIGDRANRDALDAFEETRDAWAPLGLRPRIEHAQLLARGGPAALRASSASRPRSSSATPRPTATSPTRFWAGMTDGAYAYRSLLDSGAVVANGSDAPIEELDPLAGIRAGVLRTLDERAAWHPEQAVTVEQALEATILAPAWLARRRAPPRQAAPRATSPTSSCSTATRSRRPRRSSATVEVVRRWSAAAGCTTRRPGTDPPHEAPVPR